MAINWKSYANGILATVQGASVTMFTDGAVPVAAKHIILDGESGTVALTMAVGDVGEVKFFECCDATSAVTLVPTALADGASTTLTFAVGQWSVLISDGTAWYVAGGTAVLS